MYARQTLPDLARGLDEGDGIIVMLLDPGRDGEDIGIENDVFRRKAQLIDKDVIGALAYLDLALFRVGLALLVERHHHHGRAIGEAGPRLLAETLLAFFQRDGIDDGLALHAFQARLDHLPFGAVDHDRHAGNIRLGGDEIEEGDHGLP